MRLVRRYFLSAHVLLVTVVSFAGCGGHKSQAHSPHHHDTLVPQETQKEAERNMGEQQMMMNDLNMTPSERAGQTHQRATDRRQKNNDDVKR